MRKKKILYTGLKYHYAKPHMGFSYEYNNFYDSLLNIKNLDVKEFDWVTLIRKYGKAEMNKLLIKEVKEFKPDLVFFSIFRDEFNKETLKKISKKTITFNWFADDVSRFESFIKYWAFYFNWVSTLSESLIPKYKSIGYKNVVLTQWASNPRIYRKLNLPKKYNITFVGQAHGNRKRIVAEIKRKGFDIHVWGWGWKSNQIELEKMVEIFNQSKINLNFTLAAYNFRFYTRFLPWFLQSGVDFLERGRSFLNGRTFEVPACGGFQLSGEISSLGKYYKIGEEIIVYKNLEDLAEKTKYYLKNENAREKIAHAGFERTLKDHTYEKRFLKIFNEIGLCLNN